LSGKNDEISLRQKKELQALPPAHAGICPKQGGGKDHFSIFILVHFAPFGAKRR
jgi:hypothetical protein